MEVLEEYMNRTGDSRQEALAGISYYGIARVLELLAEANTNNKKLVYFYASEEDQLADKLSYKFE